jgi:hypothetical protein
MTESTYERELRATSPSPRPEFDGDRRARRSHLLRIGTRVAMRGLIVAGFAGAAWLLSSSAAHASEGSITGTGSTATPGAASLTSLVAPLVETGGRAPAAGGMHGTKTRGKDHGGLGVVGMLTPAGNLVTTILPEATGALVPDEALGSDRANGATASTAGTTAARSILPADGLLAPLGLRGPLSRGLTRSIGADPTLGSGQAITSIRLVSQGQDRPVPLAASTLTAKSLTRAASKPTGRSVRVDAADATRSTDPVDPMADRPATSTTAMATDASSATADGGTSLPGTASPSGSRHHARSGHTPVRVIDRTGWQGTLHVPLLPRPAPVPAYPVQGITSGVPSSMAGPDHDGGAFAFVPAPFAAPAVANHRLARAVDVAVPSVFVEDPTVSPD